MLLPILFGLLCSALLFFILRALFEDYNHGNIFLYYIYALIYALLGVLILIFRVRLAKIFYNITFWNTIFVANLVIAILITGYILWRQSARLRSKK
ncbi:MAG: hypothetical protein ONB16_01965 [candidate division KSB1 bacterium]|nr:hypothetical protein [candidate division KSB1 bacterium]